MKHTSVKTIFLTLGISLAAAMAPAASPRWSQTAAPTAEQTLKTATELVKLDVTVLDDQGNFVDGLKQGDFRVFDDGIEQPIVFFAPVTDAAKVVVVLETSPAVYLFRNQHVAAAYALMNGLAPDDEVSLITYSDAPQGIVPFTTNKLELLNALNNLQYTMGSGALNLYDTVSDVIEGLKRFPGKKAIVLLTTGLDSSSPEQWNALQQKLRGSDVVIFSVGLLGPLATPAAEPQKHRKKIPAAAAFNSGDPGDSGGGATIERADQGLQSLSTMTGGLAYFPGSGDGFAAAYREIAACLRHQYVVGIAPEHDGQFHTLTVNVGASESAVPGKKKKKHKKKKHGETEYRVAFRQGYVAPSS